MSDGLRLQVRPFEKDAGFDALVLHGQGVGARVDDSGIVAGCAPFRVHRASGRIRVRWPLGRGESAQRQSRQRGSARDPGLAAPAAHDRFSRKCLGHIAYRPGDMMPLGSTASLSVSWNRCNAWSLNEYTSITDFWNTGAVRYSPQPCSPPI